MTSQPMYAFSMRKTLNRYQPKPMCEMQFVAKKWLSKRESLPHTSRCGCPAQRQTALSVDS